VEFILNVIAYAMLIRFPSLKQASVGKFDWQVNKHLTRHIYRQIVKAKKTFPAKLEHLKELPRANKKT